jgi:4'-phosphopantetheinyl transferase
MRGTAESTWEPGPLRPLLAKGAVDVWRADLTTVAGDLGELLCTEETARARRLLNERDRELWRRSRGLLRVLLGRYLRREPSSLRFTIGEHGKPALLESSGEATAALRPPSADVNGLSFNMSHSGQLALYAFSTAGAVGVDVETARRAVNEVAIAARMLGQAEARRLEQLDPDVRQREFLRAWARHEAELKCLGVGIGAVHAELGKRERWIAELELGPSAAAAVAAERPVRELCCWDWRM